MHLAPRIKPHPHRFSSSGPSELKISHTLTPTHLWAWTPEWILPSGLFSQQPVAFEETARPLTTVGPTPRGAAALILIQLNLLWSPQGKGGGMLNPAPLTPVSSSPTKPHHAQPGLPLSGAASPGYSSSEQQRVSRSPYTVLTQHPRTAWAAPEVHISQR